MDWTGDSDALRASEAIFHFPRRWEPDLKNAGMHRLGSVVGFIEFCADLGVLALNWPHPGTLSGHDELEAIASLQELLRVAVKGPENSGVDLARPSDKFLAQIRKELHAVRWEPHLERHDDGSVVLRHHAYIRSAQGVLALLAILLMDQKHRELIRQCGIPTCPHFFVISPEKTGRRGYYCNHHSDEDIDATRKRRERVTEKLSKRYPKRAVDDAVWAVMRDHPDEKHTQELVAFAEAHLRHARKRT